MSKEESQEIIEFNDSSTNTAWIELFLNSELISAITVYLSCGKTLKKSCEMAIKYVNHAIRTEPKYGKGNGPINHLNSFNLKRKFL